LGFDEEYNLGKIIINPKYRFIPFAQTGAGDLYFFWYYDRCEEPKIVLYGHDTGDMTLWANDFDEFLFIQLGSSVVDWDNEIKVDAIQAHLKFLKDEYKVIFEHDDVEIIKSAIKALRELTQIDYLVEK